MKAKRPNCNCLLDLKMSHLSSFVFVALLFTRPSAGQPTVYGDRYEEGVEANSYSYESNGDGYRNWGNAEFPRVVTEIIKAADGSDTPRRIRYYYNDNEARLSAVEVIDENGSVYYDQFDEKSCGKNSERTRVDEKCFLKVTVHQKKPTESSGTFVRNSEDKDGVLQLQEYKNIKLSIVDADFKGKESANNLMIPDGKDWIPHAAKPAFKTCPKDPLAMINDLIDAGKKQQKKEDSAEFSSLDTRSCGDFIASLDPAKNSEKNSNFKNFMAEVSPSNHQGLYSKKGENSNKNDSDERSPTKNNPEHPELRMQCIEDTYHSIWTQLAAQFYTEPKIFTCDGKGKDPQVPLPSSVLAKGAANNVDEENAFRILWQDTLINHVNADEEAKKGAKECNLLTEINNFSFWSKNNRPELNDLIAYMKDHLETFPEFRKTIARDIPRTIPCENKKKCQDALLRVGEDLYTFCNGIMPAPNSCAKLKQGFQANLEHEIKLCSQKNDEGKPGEMGVRSCIFELYQATTLPGNPLADQKSEEKIAQMTPTQVASNDQGSMGVPKIQTDPDAPLSSNFDPGATAPYYQAAMKKVAMLLTHQEVLTASPTHVTQNGPEAAPSAEVVTDSLPQSLRITPTTQSPSTITSNAPLALLSQNRDQVSQDKGLKISLKTPPAQATFTLTTSHLSEAGDEVPNQSKVKTKSVAKPLALAKDEGGTQWLKELVLSQGKAIEAFLSTPWLSKQLEHYQVKVKLVLGSEQKTFGPKKAKEEWVLKRSDQTLKT